MTAFSLTTTTPQSQSPYLTAEEYRRAPSGVDTSSLVRGDAAASLAELNNIIQRASSWADQMCNQVLGATADVESGRVTVSRDGYLRVHPRFNPVLAVTAFSYGDTPGSLSALSDLSGLWVDQYEFTVPLVAARTWTGALGFSGGNAPGGQVYAQWAYQSGYPNTTLAASAIAGATAITVKDATGILPGTTLTIYDSGATEQVDVSPSYSFGSTTVTLAAGLAFAHPQTGVAVSALPAAVKQAVVLLTSALIKTRSASSITMQSVRDSPDRKAAKNVLTLDEAQDAREMLAPFRRVR